jgi:hypothetical protein
MPVWDDGKPHGNIPLSQLDNETRDQFAVTKDALLREHLFPNTFAVDAGLHSQGSARTHVVVAATADASLSNGLSTSTGMIRVNTDDGVVKFCTDGSTDTWVEITALAGIVSAVIGALTVTGISTLQGNVLAQGGLDIATLTQLVVPAGEAWLQNGVTSIEPHNLRDRLHDTDTPGLQGDEFDHLANSIHDVDNGRVVLSSALSDSGIDESMTRITKNFSTRRTTSRALIFAHMRVASEGGFSREFTSYLATSLDSPAGKIARSERDISTEPNRTGSMFTMAYVQGIANASGRNFYHNVTVTQGSGPYPVGEHQMIYVDLGTED